MYVGVKVCQFDRVKNIQEFVDDVIAEMRRCFIVVAEQVQGFVE